MHVRILLATAVAAGALAGGAAAAEMHPALTAKLSGMGRMIQSMPGSYVVWVDTKGHMGELRGTLAASMSHM